MDAWETIAERKILEAMAEGAFANLTGKGQPLDLNNNPYEDPSTRMGHRLLRNNGFAPAWIEEAKDLEREIERVCREFGGRGEVWQSRIADLNRRILEHNLKTPSPQFHLRTLDF